MDPLSLLLGGANMMTGMIPMGIGLFDRHRMEQDPLLQQAITQMAEQYNASLGQDPFNQQRMGIEGMFGQSPFQPAMQNLQAMSGMQGPSFTDSTNPLASLLGVQGAGQSGPAQGNYMLQGGPGGIELPESGYTPFMGGPVDTSNLFGPSMIQGLGPLLQGWGGGNTITTPTGPGSRDRGGGGHGYFDNPGASPIHQLLPGLQDWQFPNQIGDMMNRIGGWGGGAQGGGMPQAGGGGGMQDAALKGAGDGGVMQTMAQGGGQGVPAAPTAQGQPPMTANQGGGVPASNAGAGMIPGGESLLQRLIQNPMSMTQDVQDQIFNRGAGQIAAGTQDLQRQLRDAVPGGGVQGGATQRRAFDAEMGRLDSLGNLRRDIGIESARTNFQDLMGAAGLQADVTGRLGDQMLAQNMFQQGAFDQNMNRALGMNQMMAGMGQQDQSRAMQLLERLGALNLASEERPRGMLNDLVSANMARMGGGAPNVQIQGGGFSPMAQVTGGGGGGSTSGDISQLLGMLSAYGMANLF